MKRILAGVLILVSLCWAADARFPRGTPPASNPNLRQENFFGLTGSAWQNFVGNYTPGLGNPAVSTADYYHQDGVYWMRPYDLLNSACGATGASIAASRGRYVWFSSVDHPTNYNWVDGVNISLGYSNDPGVPPSVMTPFYAVNNQITPAPVTATITASISGNSLIVTAVTGGVSYNSNATVSGAGVTSALLTAFVSGTPGGIGTYTINGSPQTVSSQSMTITQANYKIYQIPFFACNPDDATNPFYVYAEGNASSVQHEEGLVKSPDLITWTAAVPSHVTYTFGSTGSWTSFQRPIRDGVNSWHSTGLQAFYPGANYFASGRWSSTDGQIWTPDGPASLFNVCLPPNSTGGTGATPCPDVNAVQLEQGAQSDTITIGVQGWAAGRLDSYTSVGTRSGSQWVGRDPINSTFNVLSSPTRVNVSAAYGGVYPGPSYLQGASPYLEDGILHYYAQAGFPPSDALVGTVSAAPYANGGSCFATAGGVFQVTGSTGSNVLTVTAVLSGTVVNNAGISGTGIPVASGVSITGQLTGAPGGVGTYSINNPVTAASTTITGLACGGIWQQSTDYYTEIVDPAAAAGAAPSGVRASCASSVATINWYSGVLPTDTMRLYRGTAAGSQTTLVGDFTGSSATDSGMTLNAVTYYKLVYLNGGVEKKSRVVSTYCSTSSVRVNAHMTRALAAGADPATCNRSVMDTVDNWLVSNDLYNNLLFGTMVQFCVAQNGSNQISKIFDIGTTRLPRGGDYTPTTTSTTYNATGINGNPAWSNGSNVAWGYYGNGRFNNIRRKSQITAFSAYKKPGTAIATTLALGQGTGMVLYHSAGSPGGANFLLSDATQTKTATGTITGLATDFHTLSGTFDGTTSIVYADAVAGSGTQTGLVIPSPSLNPPDVLTGQIGGTNNMNFLGSGSTIAKYNFSAAAYQFSNNEALFDGGANFVWDKALTPAQISSFHTLIKTTIYGL